MATALFLASLFAPAAFVLAGLVLAVWPPSRFVGRAGGPQIAQPAVQH